MPLEIIPDDNQELETSIYSYIHKTLNLTIKSAHIKVAGVRPSILEKSLSKIKRYGFSDANRTNWLPR